MAVDRYTQLHQWPAVRPHVIRWLALLSGGLLVASFPKFGHPAFAWIALTPLMVAIALATARSRVRRVRSEPRAHRRRRVLRRHALLGRRRDAGFGGLPSVVAALVGLLLAAYLALYPACSRCSSRRAFGASGLPASGWRRCSGLRPSGCGRRSAAAFPGRSSDRHSRGVLPVVQLSERRRCLRAVAACRPGGCGGGRLHRQSRTRAPARRHRVVAHAACRHGELGRAGACAPWRT